MQETQHQSHSRIFGLIIGINAYLGHDYGPLTGAVADADAVSNFLINDLRANPDHIRNLRDGEATRAEIIKGIKLLAVDDRIGKDDPIIIYFAGHGARTHCPSDLTWKAWVSQGEMIEMICPVDLGVEDANNNDENKFTLIPGIPDRTIATLLNRLSKAKGNNIVSLCLCNPLSTGASRAQGAVRMVARNIPNPPSLPADCDSAIIPTFNARGGNISLYSEGQGQESHVLLAACGREEVAYENPDTHQGVFTAALLEVLKRYSHSEDSLTYTSLMKELHLKRVPQNPHCFGSNNNCLLFSLKVGADPSLIPGTNRKDKLTLNAGTLQGIYPGTRLAIYQSSLLGNLGVSLGILEAVNVQDFRALLKSLPGSNYFPIPETFFAKETGWRIRVYSKQRGLLEDSLGDALLQTRINNRVPSYNSLAATGVMITDNQEDSDLQITYESDTVFFDRAKDYGTIFIGSRFPVSRKSDDALGILAVIVSAARYNHHLFITNTLVKEITPKHDLIEEQGIELEFFTLSRTVVGFDWEVTPSGPNIVVGNVIDMVVDSDEEWGIRLVNNSSVNLYPHLFFFDAWDLTIRPWYLPEIGTHAHSHLQHHGPRLDCPLPAQNQLNIGYGDSGALPWCFNLREGVEAEIGYLKLYLTTQPVDLKSFEQPSPFAHDEEGARGKNPSSMQPPASLNSVGLESKAWCTKTYVIIQRRSAPPEGSPPAPQFNPPKLASITSEPQSSSKTHLLLDPNPSKEVAPTHTRGKKTSEAKQKLEATDKSDPGEHTLLKMMMMWWGRLGSLLCRRGDGDAIPGNACGERVGGEGMVPTDSQVRNDPTRSYCSPIKAFREVGRTIHRCFSYLFHWL